MRTQQPPHLSLRIGISTGQRFGPGKARLLALIGQHGSISAAARDMQMSYRRAWLLVEEVNAMGTHKLVASRAGGARGGGAELTDHGRAVLLAYERLVDQAARSPAMEALSGLLEPGRTIPA